MTKRKKKIILIQVLIFLLAVSLIYFTYYNKDNIKVEETNKPIIKQDDKELNNVFEDVEYNGIDLNGNRYVIQSEYADFNLEKPELINMKIMKTIFYFKDGTILIVTGDYGKYNNKSRKLKGSNFK